MNDVQIEFSRTRGDILNGITANTLRSPGTLAWYVVGALIVAAIAVIVDIDEGLDVAVVSGAVAFVVMLLAYAVILALCILFAARKTWRSVGALGSIKLTFSDEGLRAQAQVGEGFSQWVVWKAAFETRSLIVIRHQLNLIQIIPKQGLSEATLASIRALLSAHIPHARFELTPARRAA